jgi:hypothetical protein
LRQGTTDHRRRSLNEPGDKLAVLLSAWTAMLRTGRTAELADILGGDVV